MSNTHPKNTVIVGTSLAGLRAAEEIRRRGYRGKLTLVGDERHFPPYDRPPLSKEVLLGKRSLEDIRLRSFQELDAQILVSTRAVGLDLQTSTVTFESGRHISFDAMLIATGTNVRRLDCVGGDLPGVHYIYSADDAAALLARLAERPRVIVVGGGFVSAEAASVCRQLGLDVTMVSRSELPMSSAVGAEVADLLLSKHGKEGVTTLTGLEVNAVLGETSVEGVELSDGTHVPGELVIVGIGSVPSVGWLAGSGLDTSNGLVCDRYCAAVGSRSARIVAAGDVASWFNPLIDEQTRIAHWTNAAEQAEYAAGTLLEGPSGTGYSALPYLWSDQYDFSLHVAGTPGDDIEVLHGSLDEGSFVLAQSTRGTRTAVIGMNMTGAFQRERRQLAAELRSRQTNATSAGN